MPRPTRKDVAEVRSGGWLLYDSSWPLDEQLKRPDVTYLGVPLAEMCNAPFKGVRERILMKNIAYAGALAALLDIDTDVIRALLKEKFGKKPALMDSNQKAVDLGYDYAKAHFDCPLPIHLAPLDTTKDAILIDGNTAAALGCLYAGATVGAWYPITPATSLMEAFKGFCQKYRREPETKQRTASRSSRPKTSWPRSAWSSAPSWAGARAFTPTAGPGHLADERVHRPGLLRRGSGGDLRRAAHRAVHRHADAHAAGRPDDVRLRVARRHAAHLPLSRPTRARRSSSRSTAFDLAERFQTPVFVLSDLDIGMNDWMVPKLTWDDSYRPDRGKVLSAEELEQAKNFYALSRRRRRRHPASHAARACIRRARTSRAARATTSFGAYTEDADEYVEVLDRIDRKIQRAARAVPQPIIRRRRRRAVGLVTVGGCHAACIEALDLLAKDGIALDYMRVRGFPFGDEVRAVPRARTRSTSSSSRTATAQLRSLLSSRPAWRSRSSSRCATTAASR